MSERGEDAGQFEEVGHTVMGSVGDEEEECEDGDGDDDVGRYRVVHRVGLSTGNRGYEC